jgi:hypothetical protein
LLPIDIHEPDCEWSMLIINEDVEGEALGRRRHRSHQGGAIRRSKRRLTKVSIFTWPGHFLLV